MIKIRNKRIALLLVLAMLATMFVGVGTASAATNFTDVNSSYTWVDADEEQTSGEITISDNNKFNATYMPTTPDTMWIEITLPEGVTFTDNDSDTMTIDRAWKPTFPIELGSYELDIDSDKTGSITAKVAVWYTLNDGVLYEESSESQIIAKINDDKVNVTAGKAKSVNIGSDQKGAAITVKENSPASFEYDQQVKFSILTSGVTFYDWSIADTGLFDVYKQMSNNSKVVTVDLDDNDDATSKFVFTPFFKINPTASGDVVIKVSGDNITTTEFTVAKIGAGGIAVTVKNADEDFVFRGQTATLDDVTVTLDPDVAFDEDRYFTVTLPEGVKFQKEAYSGQKPIQVKDDNGLVEFTGLYNSDRSAWFVGGNQVEKKFKLSDFLVIADANAKVGDLEITFGGEIEGTYKIGTIKNAFTVTTTPFMATSGLYATQVADLLITETEDGALKPTDFYYYGIFRDNYDYDRVFSEYVFDITLPAGLTFVGTPTIKVTKGDLVVDESSVTVGEDHRVLTFLIEEGSSVASTITISNISYNVLNQPALGDLVAEVGGRYNVASQKSLERPVIGQLATHPTATYVIGAPTFTVNGVVENVVTPSYIKNGRTYLAIRDIATGLGIDPMNVLWDAVGQKVTLVKGDKIVQVTIASNTMYVNGIAIAMDVAPEINNGRTMLPAAFIAQAFGASASWDALTQTVTIK